MFKSIDNLPNIEYLEFQFVVFDKSPSVWSLMNIYKS